MLAPGFIWYQKFLHVLVLIVHTGRHTQRSEGGKSSRALTTALAPHGMKGSALPWVLAAKPIPTTASLVILGGGATKFPPLFGNST